MDSSLEIKNNPIVPKEFVNQNLTVFEKILSELESISNVAKEILSQKVCKMERLIMRSLKNFNMKLTVLHGLKHTDSL